MIEPARAEVVDALAARSPGATLTALAGDASTRRFFRWMHPDGTTQIVMDYGAPFRPPSDDQVLTELLAEAGLPVAAIAFTEPDAGFLVVEDLGLYSLEDCVIGRVEHAAPLAELYRQAIGWAARLADVGTEALARSARADGPALDAARFRFEMDFFREHYLGARPGARDPALVERLRELADRAARATPRVLCHRDFHSRNLVLRRDGGLGIVDIQDAQWGPEGYDLASLLFDPYADLPEDARRTGLRRYAEMRGPDLPETFDEAFRWLATQRLIKALGTFGYQFRERGSRRYLDSVPAALRGLDALRLELGPDGRDLFDALERARYAAPLDA